MPNGFRRPLLSLLLVLALLPCAAVAAPPAELDDAGLQAFLDEHRGEVIVVNFWATWCKPCRYELPDLARLHTQYGGDGVAILGVSVDADPAKVEKFMRKDPLPYPVRVSSLDLRRNQGAFMIPLTLVFDPNGDLAERHVGYVAGGVVEGDIQKLLAVR